MEVHTLQEHFLTFNSNNISDKLKKVAEIELNEKESEIQEALNNLKDHLKSK